MKVRASLGLLNLLIVLGALLFGGAGTLRYPQARLLLGLVRGDPVLAID